MSEDKKTKEPEAKKGMSSGVKVGIGCCGILVIVGIIGIIGSAIDGGDKSSKTSSSPTTSQAQNKETPKPKSWQTVVELNGTANKRSDTFQLEGGKTKMTYNFDGGDMIVGSIYVVKEGKSLEKDGGFPEVMISKPGSDETFLTKSKGTYYLDVTGANTSGWTVKIEEEK